MTGGKIIDLRSDTVTRPTAAMRAAMAAAEVGDDVYGEDPTVNRLEDLAAARLGTEAALFCASGTQSNLVALLSHCGRGDEYIAGQRAHCYRNEGGGAAVLGGIQPQPLEMADDGAIDLAAVRAAVKPADAHFARTRLLCLENTFAGRVVPPPYVGSASALARELGLRMHLDGARIWNASVRSGVPVDALARPFDTVSVCLSKGLGAPAGSLLCGPRDLVREARRWRKVVGGGMRQAGVLAAAGLVALTRHVDRLAEDHENALRLARGLAQVAELSVDLAGTETNMVHVRMDPRLSEPLAAHLADRGIRIRGAGTIRLVTHLDVEARDVDGVVDAVKRFFRAGPA